MMVIDVWHGSDESFDRFHTEGCFGAHFGTQAAARARLKTSGRGAGRAGQATEDQLRRYSLAIERPLHLDDLGTWTFQGVARALRQAGVATAEQIDAAYEAFNLSDAQGWASLKATMGAAGYDSATYTNAVEDAGSISWIALEADQVIVLEHESESQPDAPRP